jgi:triosephosphate isomerase
MLKKYVFGNWKMHSLRTESAKRASLIASHPVAKTVQVALFPPLTSLETITFCLRGTEIAMGAQDCSVETEGAYTGDVSAAMLKDIGCKYVLVGHSERRSGHGETSEQVKSKASAALKAGLTPVICVGENLQERESGKHVEVVSAQIRKSLPALLHSDSQIIAYEPVWAIGTGKTPTVAQISEMHKTIASLLTYATSGAHTPILYGGSVKGASAREILSTEGVDGVLVGGASLNATEFCAIIAAAE